MRSAIVLMPGDGERHGAGVGSSIVIKATGADTGDLFFLSETTIAPGFAGPPSHRHERLHDMFYVLEGALTMQVEDTQHALQAGTFVCVPPGVAHTFSNLGPGPVRFLNFNTPAGWEHYMRELGHAAQSEPLTTETIGRIASRHDFQAAWQDAATAMSTPTRRPLQASPLSRTAPPLLPCREAVAQTLDRIQFLCLDDKSAILLHVISVALRPLWPGNGRTRGRPKPHL